MAHLDVDRIGDVCAQQRLLGPDELWAHVRHRRRHAPAEEDVLVHEQQHLGIQVVVEPADETK